MALEIFYFQAKENQVYRDYLRHIGINSKVIKQKEQIPYLPISFFKNLEVKTFSESQCIFMSSGTGGNRSKHSVQDLDIYETSFKQHFNHAFGNFKQYHHLALLPNYLEQGNSSLVYQVNYFIENSNLGGNFFLHDFQSLRNKLQELSETETPTILWGVTFALLEFIEEFNIHFPNLIVIETGGMKGRGKELIRKELHQKLKESFPNSQISSEYGMTELFSQAYWNIEKQYFTSHLSLEVSCRPVNDPLGRLANNRHGVLNIMDLNNWSTCSFIASDDLGISYEDGFNVLGRLDHSEIRGCSLLYG